MGHLRELGAAYREGLRKGLHARNDFRFRGGFRPGSFTVGADLVGTFPAINFALALSTLREIAGSAIAVAILGVLVIRYGRDVVGADVEGLVLWIYRFFERSFPF